MRIIPTKVARKRTFEGMGRWATAQDRMRRLQGLTPRRARNLLRLKWSYMRAQRTGQPDMPAGAMPTSISIEPTTSCLRSRCSTTKLKRPMTTCSL